MREWSTPLRGSSSSENKSLLSGSRIVLAASTFDNFAVDGSANRFSTSGSQRSCAVRSFEVRSVELARPKPRVATAVTTKITTQPATAAINHARVVNLRGVGPELLIGYLTKVPLSILLLQVVVLACPLRLTVRQSPGGKSYAVGTFSPG